jgi:hypothetical protein
MESFAHNSGHSSVYAEYSYSLDLQTPAVKEEIHHYSFQYSAHLSAHPNDLTVNLMELPDNR